MFTVFSRSHYENPARVFAVNPGPTLDERSQIALGALHVADLIVADRQIALQFVLAGSRTLTNQEN